MRTWIDMDPREREEKKPKPEPKKPVEVPDKGARPESPRGPQPGGGDESGHS